MEAFDFHWKVMRGMRRVKEQSERLTHPFCTEHGITMQQLRILMTLHQEGPQTVSALARSTCMAGANISALAKRLATEGFLHRERGRGDERQVYLSLTQQGLAMMQGFENQCDNVYAGLASNISSEDAEVIIAGIDRLTAVLEQQSESTRVKSGSQKETMK